MLLHLSYIISLKDNQNDGKKSYLLLNQSHNFEASLLYPMLPLWAQHGFPLPRLPHPRQWVKGLNAQQHCPFLVLTVPAHHTEVLSVG